jgi:hypothetical protein
VAGADCPADVNPPCGGQIAPTATTCETFAAETSEDLNQIQYSRKGQEISQTNPGVFFYYTTFLAPASDFTVQITQSESHPTFDTLFAVQGEDQVRVFFPGCNTYHDFTFTNGGGQVTIDISGVTAGEAIIISVKYQTSSVVGQDRPTNPDTVHYSFSTYADGILVDSNANGLDLVPKPTGKP